MSAYSQLKLELKAAPKAWLVTGVAGFIGSHLLETLLGADQQVMGLDNFATGTRDNLEQALAAVTPAQRENFTFIEGDICDLSACRRACRGADYVLHQAALGSVPRSIENPLATHHSNATGFLNILVAARDERARRFVYASSSAVYGDDPALPKVEHQTGHPLSPYAVTKALNELYASVFHRLYRLEVVGLRYFNVFGPRQDPNGPYAAVIPRWNQALLDGAPCQVHGDGSTSRDFCYVANAVQANLLAATTAHAAAPGGVFNIALNARTTLNELFECIRRNLAAVQPRLAERKPAYGPFRAGDVPHSLADISHAKSVLGYAPTHTLEKGLKETVAWHANLKTSR